MTQILTIDKQALRLAANGATKGRWIYSRSGFNSNVQGFVELPRGGKASVVICKLFRSGWRGELKTAQDAAFIAAVSPATVLALLDENERMCRDLTTRNGEVEDLKKRVAELEKIATDCDMVPAKANIAMTRA